MVDFCFFTGRFMKEYYVYAHRKATTGEIFYIGKGTGRRAWGTIDRNPFWQAVARKHGFTIEIIEDQLQEWYAYELEQTLIAGYGRRNVGTGILTNITEGGKGVSGIVQSAKCRKVTSERSKGLSNPKADLQIYQFTNIETGEIFVGRRYDLEQKIGKTVADLFSSDIYAVNGWTEGSRNPLTSKADLNVYTFVHSSGETFQGIRKAFTRKYGISLKALFTCSPVLTVKGWYLLENQKAVIEKLPYYFKTVQLQHVSGTKFEGPLEKFRDTYGFCAGKLFHKETRHRTWKGWSVYLT